MRTVDQTALNALANSTGTLILRVLTWADLTAYNAAPTVPERTWLCDGFDIFSTSAKASLISDNDYTVSDFTVFIIERGVELLGVEYPIQSGIYFVSKFSETPGRIHIEGSSYPNLKITIAGDDTYENVITAFCTAIGKTAVFKDSTEAWLGYQFLPAGKQVILNKAERFENLIKQKYTIQCYERSPKVLVFYVTSTAQSAWKDITYADSKFVVVGTSGSHKVATSTDGAGWTKQSAASFSNAIAYSSTLDLFVAVGNSTCITSPDGVTWTTRTIGAYTWTDVVWNGTIFIATASNGTVTYSTNGTSWNTVSSGWTGRSTTANYYLDVAWSPSLALFAAIHWGTGTDTVRTSTDGITWTARTGTTGFWTGVTWAASLSLFVAVGQTVTDQGVMTSADGTTWTARSSINESWASVTWSSDLSLLVAVGTGGKVMTSANGTAWTERTAAEANSWTEIVWSHELSLFVAVSSGGTNRVMRSADGITWFASTTGENNSWQGLAWSPSLALFAAVSLDGTNRIITSPMTSFNPANIFGNAIANSGTTQVIIGISTAYSSTDGEYWTARTIPAGTYNAVTYGNSLFAAVGTSSKCATSPDGITWTARTIPTGTYYGIEWSSTLALFVAVGNGVISTSPDGITWTARTVPAANNWQSVAWSATLGLFIVASSDGTYRLAQSTNGIDWISLTTLADFSLEYDEGTEFNITHGLADVHYLWRDEASTTHTLGDTTDPAWNLGYLESTDSPPSEYTDPFYKFYLKKAPIRLDITDGDRVHFSPYWTLDPTKTIDASVIISEHLNTNKSPTWWQDIKSIALFEHTEGGALPSTIERVGAYTPLVSAGFDGNLTPQVNNLQALAQAVDDLTLGGGGTPPTTTAANDFQVGDGAGAWIKNTLAQVLTTLTEGIQDIIGAMVSSNTETGIAVTYNDTNGKLDFDAQTAGDLRYAPIAKGVTNGDSHDHAGGDGAAITDANLSTSDITTNDVSTTKHGFVPKAPNDTSKYLRGDGTWATAGGHTIQEEGSNLTSRTNLNFVGAEITATDDAGNDQTDVTVTSLALPEGVMKNGRILVTVASNNLTLALKTVAGANPSATDPIRVVINGVERIISSALSVTANSGTSWMGLGAAELATIETDLFAYLGYNATDGVVLGFSRYPDSSSYGEFSTTTTNEKYCKISTITNAASTDYYCVIARFCATLSAGAGYTWTVPTFTAINLKQYPIWETRWLNWTPTLTGFSANPTSTIYNYRVVRNMCTVNLSQGVSGTSNSTAFTATAPWTAITLTNFNFIGGASSVDNGVAQTLQSRVLVANATNTITAQKDWAGAAWTASGGKRVQPAQTTYQI